MRRSTRCRRCRATRKSLRSLPSRKPALLPTRKRPTQRTPKPPMQLRLRKMKRAARPRTAPSLPPTLTKARKAKMKVKVQTLSDSGSAKTGGDIELNDKIFAVEPRADILHRVVTWQLVNRRAPARAARERSDVARTGKKFGRQKGGGTARHGDRRAPIFIGGGKAHGPRARVFTSSLNKKVRQLGLKMALSSKAKDGNLIVVDNLDVAEGKTKTLKQQLGKLGFGKTALVIERNALT